MGKTYIVITLEPIYHHPIEVYRTEADDEQDREEVYESFQTNNNIVVMLEETDIKELIDGDKLIIPIKS